MTQGKIDIGMDLSPLERKAAKNEKSVANAEKSFARQAQIMERAMKYQEQMAVRMARASRAPGNFAPGFIPHHLRQTSALTPIAPRGFWEQQERGYGPAIYQNNRITAPPGMQLGRIDAATQARGMLPAIGGFVEGLMNAKTALAAFGVTLLGSKLSQAVKSVTGTGAEQSRLIGEAGEFSRRVGGRLGIKESTLYGALRKSSDYDASSGFLASAENIAVTQRRKMPQDAILAGLQAVNEGRLTKDQASFYLEKGMYSKLREAPQGTYLTNESATRAAETEGKFTVAEANQARDYRRAQEIQLQRFKEKNPAASVFLPDMAIQAGQNVMSGFDMNVGYVSPAIPREGPSPNTAVSGERSGALMTQSPRGSGAGPVNELNNTMKALINRIDSISRPPVDAGKQR